MPGEEDPVGVETLRRAATAGAWRAGLARGLHRRLDVWDEVDDAKKSAPEGESVRERSRGVVFASGAVRSLQPILADLAPGWVDPLGAATGSGSRRRT